MSKNYDAYLNDHIMNVNNGMQWLIQNVPDVMKGVSPHILMFRAGYHDDSKYSSDEYTAYDEYFYGNRTQNVKDEFDLAWLHHQHVNPHHWQHWLLYQDDGDVKALEMPKQYVIEMIADWWAFSWAKNNLHEIFDWYDKNKEKMKLHKNTKKLVEDILKQIKEKLGESNE